MALFKYVIYAVLMIVLYAVSKEFYNINFNNETSVREAEGRVASDNKNMVDASSILKKVLQTRQVHQHQ